MRSRSESVHTHTVRRLLLVLLTCTIAMAQIIGVLEVQAINGASASETKLLASDGVRGDFFGFSVANTSRRIVVGTRFGSRAGVLSGSVYVFQRSGTSWWEAAELTQGKKGVHDDSFGFSVAASGRLIVAGAPFRDDNGATSGSAYVYGFRRRDDAWVRLAKLTARDGQAGDEFGFSVATSGNRIVVGAHFDNDNAFAAGSAYVFESRGGKWMEVIKLRASDGRRSDQFGTSVATSGNRVFVGSPFGARRNGVVYVFERVAGTWVEVAQLTADDGAGFDYFGDRVVAIGNRVVVGAYRHDAGGRQNAGAVYVFEYQGGNWTQTAKLTADDATRSDWFGGSIAAHGSRVVVGAEELGFGSNFGKHPGKAYVFRERGGVWTQTAKLVASDGSAGADFGYSVAIRGRRTVVGALHGGPNESGAVYVFQ